MRIVICWSHVSGYMAACWRALAATPGVDLFVLGFGTVFVALGAASSLLGGLLGGLFDGSRPLLIRAAGSLMIVMGRNWPLTIWRP